MDTLPKRNWTRIEQELRAGLRSGALPPGSRLPSGRTLASRFGTSEWPVQRALAALVAEGVLERRPGFGTVVRKAPPAAGDRVLLAFDTYGAYSGPYRWRLAEKTCAAIASDGFRPVILPGDLSADGGVAALREAIASFVPSLVVASCRKTTRRLPFWKSLPVAVFCPGGTFSDRAVLPRVDCYARLSRILARLGAKRPALVSNLSPEYFDEFRAARREGREILGIRYEAQIAGLFDMTMRSAGFRFDRARIVGVYGDMDRTSAGVFQKRAYEAAKGLLDATPRPDVLCAYPDDLVPGVVAAIGGSLHFYGMVVPRDNQNLESKIPNCAREARHCIAMPCNDCERFFVDFRRQSARMVSAAAFAAATPDRSRCANRQIKEMAKP